MTIYESYTMKIVLTFTLHLSFIFQMQCAMYRALYNLLQLKHFLFYNRLTFFLSKSPVFAFKFPSNFTPSSHLLKKFSSCYFPPLRFQSHFYSPASSNLVTVIATSDLSCVCVCVKLKRFIWMRARRKTLHVAGPDFIVTMYVVSCMISNV